MPDTDTVVSARSAPTIDAGRRLRFERLMADVYEPLQRFVRRRIDPSAVDDTVADTLLVCWRRLDDIPEGAELAWCYGAARRCLANARRSADRAHRLTDRLVATGAAGGVEDHMLDLDLLAGLRELDERDRELVLLWAWEGLEPREIAVVLDATPNAISIRLHRLRRRLADRLGPPPSAGAAGDREQPGKDPAGAGHEEGARTTEPEEER